MKRITVILCVAAAALASAGTATSANRPDPRFWGRVGPAPVRWGIGEPIRYPIRFGIVHPNPRTWGSLVAHVRRG